MMSSKERWLAALRLQPIDRLIFWPKLDEGYRRGQSGMFSTMTIDEIHDWIGSDKHIWLPDFVVENRKNSSIKVSQISNFEETIFITKHGNTRMVKKFDMPSQSWHPIEYPIKSRDDIRVMIEIYSNVFIDINYDMLHSVLSMHEKIGSNGITANNIGESPLMHFVEWLAGVEGANYLMADYPDDVEELFDTMHNYLIRKTEIISDKSPAEILYFVENTSTTLISPEQYKTHCYERINDYGKIIKQSGHIYVLHMCGHLLNLLQYLSEVNADAFEAFTSPTLGNTRLIDGRRRCQDKCIIGGTNAILWLQSYEEIVSELEKDLGDLPHHRGIVVTSSGVMPPYCKPDKIKKVCEWVKNHIVKV